MNIKTKFLLFFFIIFVITQDGGDDGGDSGGFDSGGSDSGGVDSSGYGDSGNSGYSTGNINCDSQCGLILGLVFGIIIITPLLILCIVKFINYMKERSLLRVAQQQLQQIKVQQIKNNDVCPKYNQEDFLRIRETFLGAPWKFIFTQLQNSYNVDNLIIHMNKQTDYNYNLTMSGNDKFGSWTSSGYFQNTDKIQLWMKKQYDNKKKAHQGGKWSNLIYEGYMNDAGNYNGRWYFLKFQNDKKYSGSWSMNYEASNSYQMHSNYQIKPDRNRQTIF